MLVNIKFHDEESFTVEEVVRLAQNNYGKRIQVEVSPDSLKPHDLIYFGLQQIVTHRQLSLLFEKNSNYQHDVKKLRAEVLMKVEELLDSVIIDNESKVA